jgi:hypothetical protein
LICEEKKDPVDSKELFVMKRNPQKNQRVIFMMLLGHGFLFLMKKSLYRKRSIIRKLIIYLLSKLIEKNTKKLLTLEKVSVLSGLM